MVIEPWARVPWTSSEIGAFSSKPLISAVDPSAPVTVTSRVPTAASLAIVTEARMAPVPMTSVDSTVTPSPKSTVAPSAQPVSSPTRTTSTVRPV